MCFVRLCWLGNLLREEDVKAFKGEKVKRWKGEKMATPFTRWKGEKMGSSFKGERAKRCKDV